MLKLLGYILLLGIVVVLIKLLFSFVLALFTFTIVAFMSVGTIVFFLSVLGIIESGTAWLVLGCAVGLGLLIDAVKFLKNPGEVFSDAKEIYNMPSKTTRYSNSGTSGNDSDDRYQSDQYRKCCGSCRWLSGHSSHNDVCTLHGNEVCHSDYCSDWQS